MGKKSKPVDPPPAPPVVATTSADAAQRTVTNTQKKKKAYGFKDTLLTQNQGFTAQELDPRG